MDTNLCQQLHSAVKHALMEAVRGDEERHMHAAMLMALCQVAIEHEDSSVLRQMLTAVPVPEVQMRGFHIHEGRDAKLLLALESLFDIAHGHKLCPILQAVMAVSARVFEAFAASSTATLRDLCMSIADADGVLSLPSFESMMRSGAAAARREPVVH